MSKPTQISIFKKLNASEISSLATYLEKIEQSQRAIASCAKLLYMFQLDDECGGEIPENVKTGYVKGGLLEAIQLAVNEIDCLIEDLGTQAQFAKKLNLGGAQ
ncbi:hypothetical protein [Methylomonas sp. AM2-LC]|uniref:hypothetical protein n=1 Tax=Methylomonas sp. AM2-LC TaxID=3153301 RepID=UPI00326758D6